VETWEGGNLVTWIGSGESVVREKRGVRAVNKRVTGRMWGRRGIEFYFFYFFIIINAVVGQLVRTLTNLTDLEVNNNINLHWP
jgi:hypothetical protein